MYPVQPIEIDCTGCISRHSHKIRKAGDSPRPFLLSLTNLRICGIQYLELKGKYAIQQKEKS